MKSFLNNLPKAELHVHLEGTMGPGLLLAIAERNKIALPYTTVEQAHAAYQFTDFASFIDAYVLNTHVLCHERDFYEVTWSYVQTAVSQGVCHLELFLEVQTYFSRGIAPGVIISGMHAALQDAEKQFGMTGLLIMCFIRDRSEAEAFKALELILPYKDKVVGVGLASIEIGNPPSKFAEVFKAAKEHGFRLTAHAGEMDITSIEDTIKLLHVERIDHGIHVSESPRLMDLLVQRNIPLTICPVSNIALGFYASMADHPLRKLYDAGIRVTINSDDPAFFGGSLMDNYHAAATQLAEEELIACARNSLEVAFLADEKKRNHLQRFDAYIKRHQQENGALS